MPETPELCVDVVAGKVIQIENLQEDLDELKSFNTFFADVYCVVYKNALVTMRDGLSQIFPGGLDMSIEQAIGTIYGVEQGTDDMYKAEIAAIESFIDAVGEGDYDMDYTKLINPGQPLREALAICPNLFDTEIEKARVDREDYFNDFNFLKYLKSLD